MHTPRKEILDPLGLILMLFILANPAQAQSVNFRDVAYDQMFPTAQDEQKAVMLYFHFDGCGACVKMEQTAFVDPTVADWWNEHFVSLDVNTRSTDGAEVNKHYGVQMHPTFLFLDAEGNELHKIAGVYSPEEFLTQGKLVLSESNTLSAFHKKYENGERSGDFLLTYCYMLRDADELDTLRVNDYLRTLQAGDYFKEKNKRFVYEYCLHHFEVYTPYGSAAFAHLLEHREGYDELFAPDQVSTRIVWILNSAIYQAIQRQDRGEFEKLVVLLEPYDTGESYALKEIDNRITGMISERHLVAGAHLSYYEFSADEKTYQKVRKNYLKLIWNDASDLNLFARGTCEHSIVEERLKLALKCANRAVKLSPEFAHLDTQTWLLFTLKDYKKAVRQGEKAIEEAKRTYQDCTETEKLVKQAREKFAKQRTPSNCWC